MKYRRGIRQHLLFIFLLLITACSYNSDQRGEFLNGRILFLGDSITHNGGYVSFIEYELAQQFPERDFDIVAIGLSSETASGLTEPNEAYPRPCVHDRLDSALAKIEPDVVAVCYGMNDGIYAPQSEANSRAYKDGMIKLLEKITGAGARIMLLTPPPFDSVAAQHKITCSDSAGFSYSRPYCHYDSVLSDYSQWIMTMHQRDLLTADLHSTLSEYVTRKRTQDSTFTLSPDGVHPDPAGHLLMARTFLNSLGVVTDTTDILAAVPQIQETPLFKLIDERRTVLSDAWRVAVGHTHHREWPGLPIQEAEQKAAELRTQIHELLSKTIANR